MRMHARGAACCFGCGSSGNCCALMGGTSSLTLNPAIGELFVACDEMGCGRLARAKPTVDVTVLPGNGQPGFFDSCPCFGPTGTCLKAEYRTAEENEAE